jgi:serine/threonine protein phosphatase PrpC
MRFTIFQDSKVGDRSGNEDRVGYSFGKDVLLMVICDGMGGHEGGEVAAEIAVQEVTRRFQQEARNKLRKPFEFLVSSIQAAHRAIVAHADQHNMLECPRTTCVACVIQNGYAYWAHAGDSRLYVLRRGNLIASTQDHSKVQQMIDSGQITAEQAAKHPDRNKIFSCLGGLVEPVIDLSRRTPLRNGDLIVMCTDGLWSVYPQEEIARALTGAPILKSLPVLMREAEVRGGDEGDNLSLIVVRWGPETLTDEPTTTITETMSLGEFQTEIDRTLTLTDRKGMQRDLTDDEIERAIAEIQATIKRYKT